MGWLACLLCLPLAHAVSVDFTAFLSPDAVWHEVVSEFGIVPGGVVTISATVSGPSVYFSLFDSSNWNYWNSGPSQRNRLRTQLCRLPSFMRYEGVGNVSIRHVVSLAGRYTLQALYCNANASDVADVHGTAAIVNPGGILTAHLSSELQPLPGIYGGYSAYYFLLFCAYFIALHKHRIAGVEFKAMWLIALVSKHVSVVFTLALYCYSGATGHARPSAVGLSNSLSALADGFGLVALQAISHGWAVQRRSLSAREWSFIGLGNGVYVILSSIALNCEATSGIRCDRPELGKFLLRSIVMLCTVVAANYTIAHLRFVLQDNAWSPSVPVYYTFLNMMKSMRTVYVAYLVAPILLLIVQGSMLSWHSRWLLVFLQEGIMAVVYGAMSLIFKPESFHTFDQIAAAIDRGREEEQAPPSPHTAAPGLRHRAVRS